MISETQFQYNLWKLRRERHNNLKQWQRNIDQAKNESKSSADIGEMNGHHLAEMARFEDEIRFLVTRRILDKLDRYLLPHSRSVLDGDASAWQEAKTHAGKFYLTDQAIFELRGLIRKEQKERSELLLARLAALTGLVGALTGLIAVLGAG
jgi:hypothetical protein